MSLIYRENRQYTLRFSFRMTMKATGTDGEFEFPDENHAKLGDEKEKISDKEDYLPGNHGFDASTHPQSLQSGWRDQLDAKLTDPRILLILRRYLMNARVNIIREIERRFLENPEIAVIDHLLDIQLEASNSPEDFVACRATSGEMSHAEECIKHEGLTARQAAEKWGIEHPEDRRELQAVEVRVANQSGDRANYFHLEGAKFYIEHRGLTAQQAAAMIGIAPLHPLDLEQLQAVEARVANEGGPRADYSQMLGAQLKIEHDGFTAQQAAVQWSITHPQDLAQLRAVEARAANEGGPRG